MKIKDFQFLILRGKISDNGIWTNNFKFIEPNQENINEMDFYLRTGCVHESYLEKVLGDQRKPIGFSGPQKSIWFFRVLLLVLVLFL